MKVIHSSGHHIYGSFFICNIESIIFHLIIFLTVVVIRPINEK